MNALTLFIIVVILLFLLWFVRSSIKIVSEYERGVIFRLGRVIQAKGPGLIILIPVIAGISYEILKAAAGHQWVAWASAPGIWIQAITTKEPSDDQVEVAVTSLLAALSDAAVDEVKQRGPVVAAALSAEYDVDGANDG